MAGKRKQALKNKLSKFPKRLMKKSNGRAVGRPSKKDTVDLKIIYGLCLLGFSNSSICEFLQISHDTFHNWIDEWPEFSETITLGREGALLDVGKSLFERARGYTHDDEVIKVVNGTLARRTRGVEVVEETGRSTVVRIKTKKHYPPDVQAIMYILNNRLPKLWKNKIDEDAPPPAPSGPVVVNVITDDETAARLMKLEEEAKQRKSSQHGSEQQPEL